MLTIFFVRFIPNVVSYISEKYSDFCYNGFMYCSHVYEETETDICEKCGGNTHKTDWAFQHKLHKEWIESGKATLQGWWSI